MSDSNVWSESNTLSNSCPLLEASFTMNSRYHAASRTGENYGWSKSASNSL